VGYSDVKAFRTVFKKITGLSPLEYRNKYNREAVMA
jgi:YesN/AraC family two-component response regulator